MEPLDTQTYMVIMIWNPGESVWHGKINTNYIHIDRIVSYLCTLLHRLKLLMIENQ
jgi:hypothetical protein